jgi:hypothetical protein
MSKRKPVLPSVERVLDYASARVADDWHIERARAELHAAEAVIRAAKKMRRALECPEVLSFGAAKAEYDRAQARLDRLTKGVER